MGYKYCVLGGGRQGTAAAYDLAQFGEADEIIIADRELDAATRAVVRVNELAGRRIARAERVDANDEEGMIALLTDVQATISALPFVFNIAATRAAIAAGANYCDLGGNTEVVQQQLDMDEQAKEKGVTVIPDCGLMPGLGNILAVYAMGLVMNPREVRIYVGGLPLNPRPPFNYLLSFNMDGLINEYSGSAIYLRGGQPTEVEALTEREELDFPPPLGRCEAFVTSGGTSTVPYSLQGKLEIYEEKTVRYPGHLDQLVAFKELGLFEATAVNAGGVPVRPRDVLSALLAPRITFPEDQDVVVMRVICVGDKLATLDLFDSYDEATGFTAMERTTGFPTALVAHMMARHDLPAGATPLELAIPAAEYVTRLAERKFNLSESVT